MQKIDLKKELKHLYAPSAKEVSIVDVPDMNFLMIDGSGDPNTSQEYRDAMMAIYGVSFTLKFMLKKSEKAIDYTVMGLEGLWWADDMEYFRMGNKDKWKWTSMIMQPDFITEDMVRKAAEEVKRKKNPPALSKMRFERFHEGLAAQIMHIGPYDAEAPTIEKLHVFVEENGYKLRGKHHEIYLGDPRRSAPEKLKTIIRQPISK